MILGVRFKKKAITFLEIIIAVTVMAVAMIPIFGMLSRQTVETDKNASQAFAINKAAQVLNTIIDSVSFVALRQGNPGYIKVDDLQGNPRYSQDLRLNQAWAKNMSTMLFNNSTADSNGFACRGIVTDSKGISYLIHLRVEDIPSTIRHAKPERKQIGNGYPKEEPSDFSEQDDVNFSFLKNSSLLTSSKWTQDFAETPGEPGGKPFTELNIPGNAVSESPVNFYTDESLDTLPGNTKYSYMNPTAERFTGKMVMKKVPYPTDNTLAYCPFKRLIVQVQWNLEPKYYSEPENTKGNVQRIHLMAIKGDIDS